MTRGQQIESLFQEALQHPTAERDAWLREACNGDSGLQRDVVSLLANYREDDAAASWAAAAAAQLIDASASLRPGQSLGPYRIDSFLAAGGMGEVYRATDTRLHRDVAIKVSAARFSERFEREARVIASLNHPHICQLYDVGANYLVMEFVDGAPLKGPLPVGKAVEYARQILDALDAAHRKGITHRDLKPGNILLTRQGIKLLDFGLAKQSTPLKETDTTRALTQQGQIAGTLQYMSPEQLQGKDADARSDLFSFGCVLYEMLSGKRAFEGQSAASVIGAILEREPAPIDVPQPLDRVVRRCLAKDPDDRWQTARDARHALDDLRMSEPAADAPLPRARLWAWGVSAALAIALATTGVLLYRATRPISRPLIRFSAGVTQTPDRAFRLDSDTILQKGGPGNFLALSPDGTRLAICMRDADGKVRLATRQLDQSRFVPLPGSENAVSPFFSPDGQWIAFFAEGKLKKIPVNGGAPVPLCDAAPFASGSWGDDGNIIVALDVRGGLSRVPSAGGEPTAVTQLDRQKGDVAHQYPQILPGNQSVLFTTSTTSFGNSFGDDEPNIEVFSFKSHERKTVVRGGALGRYLPSGHLVYVHQNKMLAVAFDLSKLAVAGTPQAVLDDVSYLTLSSTADFDFSRNGTFVYISGKGELQRSIFWLNSTGKTQPLHPAAGFYSSPRFSPDGKHLAFVTRDPWNIWVEDLDRDTGVRLTSLPGSTGSPLWTPDGKHIVFWYSNLPRAGIYWTRADGSGDPQRLMELRTEERQFGTFPASFTPDGKRLAVYAIGSAFAVNIWTASIEGDPDHPRLGKAQPFLHTSGFASVVFGSPAFSPDGHWVAFALGETGRSEVYVQPFPGPGGKVQISHEGGQFPVWSPDGRELFFLNSEPRIMVVDYTAKGDSFAAGKPQLWSEKRILFREGGGPFPPYDLAPDGKRFAVLLYSDGTAEHQRTIQLTFLLNFFDELRRRVPVEGK
jgi:serine/threonine protein kinase/Tol biopolymer transport system component